MAASTSTGRSNWIVRTVIGAGVLGGFAIAVLLAIRMFGAVQGVEFSPDTFASRTFVYYEIPLIRVRVTGVYRDDISGALQSKVGGPSFTPASSVTPRCSCVQNGGNKSNFPISGLIFIP